MIVGLHPDANLEVVEDAFAKRKKREKEMGKSETVDFKTVDPQGSPVPTLEPQVCFIANHGELLPKVWSILLQIHENKFQDVISGYVLVYISIACAFLLMNF